MGDVCMYVVVTVYIYVCLEKQFHVPLGPFAS
jgi:hypothetical protein